MGEVITLLSMLLLLPFAIVIAAYFATARFGLLGGVGATFLAVLTGIGTMYLGILLVTGLAAGALKSRRFY